jgi:hypothetical protein
MLATYGRKESNIGLPPRTDAKMERFEEEVDVLKMLEGWLFSRDGKGRHEKLTFLRWLGEILISESRVELLQVLQAGLEVTKDLGDLTNGCSKGGTITSRSPKPRSQEDIVRKPLRTEAIRKDRTRYRQISPFVPNKKGRATG